METISPAVECRDRFARTFKRFDVGAPICILTHNDVDGLAAAAIFQRSFTKSSRPSEVRILGRGESPWSESVQRELRARVTGGLIVTDLGVRPGIIRPRTPTILVDHHVPLGYPPETTVITGYHMQPIPTSGLLAYWCVRELADADGLLWLAAISVIADMGENAGFEEFSNARQRYGVTRLRQAVSLLNAARRASAGHAQPAFDLLVKANHPSDITSGAFPETEHLLQARVEVAAALDKAKRIAPRIKGSIALILIDSPCQIHPLIAQQWKNRLHKNIVLVANRGYRPGWVHFSVRSATGINLIEFLKEHAPASADENYGSGHEQATGGALTFAGWNEFVSSLGYGAEMRIQEPF